MLRGILYLMDQGKYRVLKLLAWAGFFFSFHAASTIYLNSSFLSQMLPESTIGLIYGAGSIITIIGMAQLPRILRYLGSRGGGFLLLFVCIGSLVAMTLNTPVWARILSFIAYFASSILLYLFIDILIEHWGQTEFMGRIRGIYLTACNVGYVLAPILAGFLADRLGIVSLYRITIVFFIPVVILMMRFIPNIRPKTSVHMRIVRHYIAFLKSKNLRSIYIVNFILQWFYAWMVIYAPLYLHEHLGLGWDTVGILFTIALSAFVIFQTPFGYLADKKFGEKEILIMGLLLMSAGTVLFGFFDRLSVSLVGLGIILFASRIGASAVEVMSESYFFKKVDRNDTICIGFFRNTYPVAYIIGPLIAAGLVNFVPLKTLFILLGGIVLLGVLFAFKIKDTA